MILLSTNGSNKLRKRRFYAWLFLLIFLSEILTPTLSFALTGGPSQPEVQSFEPVGTSEMVDLFTGDFNYNIPLLDIEGYPINISYHSGITMDQEASWVGLGWNVNAGVINRNIRGIPDDFDGDIVTKKFHMRPNRTYGVNTGIGAEVFGFKALKLGYSIGVKYNNYTGVGAEQGTSASISVGVGGKGQLTAGLGINASSDEGLTISPNISMQAKVGLTDKRALNMGVSVGSSFNSRAGLKSVSISSNASLSQKYGTKTVKDDKGNKKEVDNYSSGAGPGGSISFDFGQQTYSPSAEFPMKNLSITTNFTIGGELFGLNVNGHITGYYSQQVLATNELNNPAYGYLNADKAVNLDNALMDFNREKDGGYTESTPALPLAIQTFDIYSVSGQGIGGSYRPYRGDLGHVFDPTSRVTSDGFTLSGEVGLGNAFHAGVDLNVNGVRTTTGRWTDDNFSLNKLNYHSISSDPLYEKVYFKEAGEKGVNTDPSFFDKMNGTKAHAIKLKENGKFYTVADDKFDSGLPLSSQNYRLSRENRNQQISFLSKAELKAFALDTSFTSSLYSNAPKNHIGEISSIGEDGKRYVYGIAAYNTIQKEVTFSTSEQSLSQIDLATNLIHYSGTDNSIANRNGTDQYFNEVETPPFAHSYLLTAVLSADYVDSDSIPGPSKGDLGNYTRFHYSPIHGYQWRVPVGLMEASFNEGFRSIDGDNKANYLYGSKELYFLDTIETKNYLAVFETEPRADAKGVLGENGGVDTSKATLLLRSITLYSKANPSSSTATIIKKVNFEYDYSRCKNVPNYWPVPNMKELVDNDNPSESLGGKLTLRKIYFTYQNSNKGRLSPYQFSYSAHNPNYNTKSYDRWGNYKVPYTTGLSVTDFPYVNQQKSEADSVAQSWTLNKIQLPSGGKINIEFEADDYAFVQNRRASQMFLIESSSSISGPSSLENNPKFYFNLQRDENNQLDMHMSHYGSAGDLIYFKFLVEIRNTSSNQTTEYIPGYAKIDDIGYEIKGGTDTVGYIHFAGIDLASNGTGSTCPIVKTAIQFARIHLPKSLWDQPSSVDENSDFSIGLLKALVESFTVMREMFSNPNVEAYDKPAARNFVTGQSWVRLSNPTKKKYGGGCRVKKIALDDSWAGQTNSVETSSQYGQEYNYTFSDGSSSGVASYEPQLGGDENPFKVPYYYSEPKLLVPDDVHYMEEPFGESFFPSPSIGYSRVSVKNLHRESVRRHATGEVVHEFYTAKEFPTITERTEVEPDRDNSTPWGLSSIFKIDKKDYMTASQGYSIEVNDMHGKQKSQMVYAVGQSDPISTIEYRYKQIETKPNTFKLKNEATVIANDGSISEQNIGLNMDMVADYRESYSSVISAGVQLNLDFFFVLVVPAVIVMPWSSFSFERTQFRSVVTTKLVQRFGILDETIASDLGSKVSTKNIAFDAETGEVLLTETKQDFNDPVFSLKYPAYWYYDGMAPSSRNQNAIIRSVSFSSTGEFYYPNAQHIFSEGDELGLYASDFTPKERVWVDSVYSDRIKVVNIVGLPISGSYSSLKVLKSGHRNQQSQPMAQLSTLTNPLQSISSNAYAKVLQAGAIEYSNGWKTYCDCFQSSAHDTIEATPRTTNPFILGIKGIWKPKRSYTYLTDRVQTKYNNNSNIRRDGVFAAFTPFYKVSSGQWKMDPPNWTYTSEVTEFSPFGQELENRDALGKYSAATFGFNQTLATAVSANARYRDIGFDSFEDYGFSDCSDNHFKTKVLSDVQSRLSSIAHTGRNSLKISANDTVTLSRQLFAVCELPDPCQVSTSFTIDTTDLASGINILVNAGINTYSIDWDVIGGQGIKTVNLNANGINISPMLENEIVSMNLTITLSNGCVVVKHVIIKIDSNGTIEVIGLNPLSIINN
ncbi:MAG: hypothetical protein EYC69_06510 [Bacteroidetes bacterium]|nr:MAG: hypothetical protein EYC69_06510 [Bacteroidota bacterium]